MQDCTINESEVAAALELIGLSLLSDRLRSMTLSTVIAA